MPSDGHDRPFRLRGRAPALLLAAALAAGCRGQAATSSAVFTPARPTLSAAVRDFFGVRPAAVQPFPFPHNTHVAKKLKCTDYCHESVDKSSIAGIPSVKTCMNCHESIAADKPLIKVVADYQKRGVDIAWQRVYGYTREAHVRFNHAPHIRSKVECATCHGNIGAQSVAERNVDLKMGFCVECHKTRGAPNECITCHY